MFGGVLVVLSSPAVGSKCWTCVIIKSIPLFHYFCEAPWGDLCRVIYSKYCQVLPHNYVRSGR